MKFSTILTVLLLPLYALAHPLLNITTDLGGKKVTELELRDLQGDAASQLMSWPSWIRGSPTWVRCAIWIQPDGFLMYALNFALYNEDHIWHVLPPPQPIRARPDGPLTAAAYQYGDDFGSTDIRIFFHNPIGEGFDAQTGLPRYRMQSALVKNWVWSLDTSFSAAIPYVATPGSAIFFKDPSTGAPRWRLYFISSASKGSSIYEAAFDDKWYLGNNGNPVVTTIQLRGWAGSIAAAPWISGNLRISLFFWGNREIREVRFRGGQGWGGLEPLPDASWGNLVSTGVLAATSWLGNRGDSYNRDDYYLQVLAKSLDPSTAAVRLVSFAADTNGWRPAAQLPAFLAEGVTATSPLSIVPSYFYDVKRERLFCLRVLYKKCVPGWCGLQVAQHSIWSPPGYTGPWSDLHRVTA